MKWLLASLSGVGVVAQAPACNKPSAYFSRFEDGSCADSCIPDKVGICKRELVVNIGGLQPGSCEASGYTSFKDTFDQDCGPCGKVKFTEYTKPGAEALTQQQLFANKCPGSPSTPHASCQTNVNVNATCAAVIAEMSARAVGSQDGSWTDPHNGGTYTVTSSDASSVQLKRVTGDHKPGPYTDFILFTLTDVNGQCTLAGCSDSQSTSIGDYSTNYCNQRNLYCGSAEGCKPVKMDWTIKETNVKPSPGASANPKDCMQ